MSYAASNKFATNNHRNDVLKRGVEDKVDDRRTPAYVFDPLHAEHGFTLDVAASAENAKCARYFDRESDGLTQSWADEIVWCNPPYSDLKTWFRKALHEIANGCRKVVMLLPANRTEQQWWQCMVEPLRDRGKGVRTRNLPGRIRFERGGGTIRKVGGRGGSHAPFGCVVVVIQRVCSRCGAPEPTDRRVRQGCSMPARWCAFVAPLPSNGQAAPRVGEVPEGGQRT